MFQLLVTTKHLDEIFFMKFTSFYCIGKIQ